MGRGESRGRIKATNMQTMCDINTNLLVASNNILAVPIYKHVFLFVCRSTTYLIAYDIRCTPVGVEKGNQKYIFDG